MITIDNQPIEATFFGEGKWLTDFITPEALDIQTLYKSIAQNSETLEQKIIACWQWVASNVRYVKNVRGRLWVEGKIATQDDLWSAPALTARVKVGNCANKAFLLTSLLRNAMPQDKVYCVLGNLYNGKAEGHAWVQATVNGQAFIIESTRSDVPIVPADTTARYEPVHLFNDREIYAIPGKTVMTPFSACYSDWLKDYLDWSYIEGRK